MTVGSDVVWWSGPSLAGGGPLRVSARWCAGLFPASFGQPFADVYELVSGEVDADGDQVAGARAWPVVQLYGWQARVLGDQGRRIGHNAIIVASQRRISARLASRSARISATTCMSGCSYEMPIRSCIVW